MTKKRAGNVFFKVDISPELLAKLDASAADVGWSRAQLFRNFVVRWIEWWEGESREPSAPDEPDQGSSFQE